MPAGVVDNLSTAGVHGDIEVRKVVGMAGVRRRHVVQPGTCSSDLCREAATRLLDTLGWERDSVTGLIMVTQSPDYFLPSTACVIHEWLGLNADCAAFDVGLGCSGYPYGLYLASTMLASGGQHRILVLHGETPSLFAAPEDRATSLLFGDAGSATGLTLDGSARDSFFGLHSDGSGFGDLIMRGGGFRDRVPADPRDLSVHMDGAAIFNFTLKRVQPLIHDTLAFAGLDVGSIDSYVFHQSNQFIMKHLVAKCGLPPERVPIILGEFGNTGGASVPLAVTQAHLDRPARETMRLMMLGYGVGLSWGAAIMDLAADAPLLHCEYPT